MHLLVIHQEASLIFLGDLVSSEGESLVAEERNSDLHVRSVSTHASDLSQEGNVVRAGQSIVDLATGCSLATNVQGGHLVADATGCLVRFDTGGHVQS